MRKTPPRALHITSSSQYAMCTVRSGARAIASETEDYPLSISDDSIDLWVSVATNACKQNKAVHTTAVRKNAVQSMLYIYIYIYIHSKAYSIYNHIYIYIYIYNIYKVYKYIKYELWNFDI